MIVTSGAAAKSCKPLGKAPEQESYFVEKVSGPDRRRLCEMGLVQGTEISVVNRARPGTMVVKVGGCRLALARNLADHVWVK